MAASMWPAKFRASLALLPILVALGAAPGRGYAQAGVEIQSLGGHIAIPLPI